MGVPVASTVVYSGQIPEGKSLGATDGELLGVPFSSVVAPPASISWAGLEPKSLLAVAAGLAV